MIRILKIVSLLIVAVLCLLFLISKTRFPFGKRNTSFSSSPKKEITRIEFSQDEEKLILRKYGEEWLINDRLVARKSGINYIIRILSELKIKSPVSSELFESEITDQGIVPVKVKVFEGRKTLKSFMVYKTGSNIYGNVMKIKENSKPFIVYVPGYDLNIGSGFTLNELYWQPYTIFNLMPSEITSVHFENLSDTSSSFSIFKNEGGYSLSDSENMLTGWDSSKVIRYLSYFTWIPFESWVFENSGDGEYQEEPGDHLFRVTLLSSAGYTTILDLWERMKLEDGEKRVDSDRLLGKTQATNYFFIVRYFDVDPVLKKRSYFFPE